MNRSQIYDVWEEEEGKSIGQAIFIRQKNGDITIDVYVSECVS